MKTNLPQDIIPARKQPEYPSSLSEKQSDQLRENPTGIIEIVEGKLTPSTIRGDLEEICALAARSRRY